MNVRPLMRLESIAFWTCSIVGTSLHLTNIRVSLYFILTLSQSTSMVWAQMIATWGMMEAANQDQFKAPWGLGAGNKSGKADFKGDFRNGLLDFGWDNQSADWQKNKRTVELNQGRAAMMGILGLMVHDKLGNVGNLLPPHF